MRSIVIIFSLFLVLSCSETEKVENKINSIEHISSKADNEEGPPFSDTCLCSFEKIGEVKSSNNRCDIFISGKGWNPNYKSCSWSWGELIYNESPSDTLLTDFRIHLVDVDKLDKKIDTTFLNSKNFNENLIATFSKTKEEAYMTCKFDPNKIGKYPKPKHWTE